jgi:3-hydroxyacyl-CoA dehydrogenase
VDRLAGEGNLLADAVAFAQEVIGKPVSRSSERPVTVDPEVFEAFRKANAKRFRGFDAPAAIIDLIEKTAGKPYAEGVQAERMGFMKLIMGAQSAALRHIFFAERKAPRSTASPRHPAARHQARRRDRRRHDGRRHQR